MTITTALILLIVTIIGVGVALAGVLIPAITGLRKEIKQHRQEISQEITGLRQEMNQEITGLRQEINQEITGLRQEINQDIASLRQEMNQQGQQINLEIASLRQEINQQGQQIIQIAQQVGHLSGLLEGLRGRPIVTEQPEEIRVG